jgi:hypothetical protein
MAARFMKAPLFQLPDALPTAPPTAHETCSLKHTQVFGDGLTSDAGTLRETGDRHRSAITEAGDKPQAEFVTERGEDGS